MSETAVIPTEEKLVIVADQFARLIGQARYLAGVDVLTERKGDINQTLRIALQKLGLAVTVIAPDADSVKTQGETLQMRVRLVAQIDELVLVNQGNTGTKKPALAVVVAAMKAVQKKPNGLDAPDALHRAGLNEFTLDEDRPFQIRADKTFVSYHVTAFTDVML